jgi:hypothetical protein
MKQECFTTRSKHSVRVCLSVCVCARACSRARVCVHFCSSTVSATFILVVGVSSTSIITHGPQSHMRSSSMFYSVRLSSRITQDVRPQMYQFLILNNSTCVVFKLNKAEMHFSEIHICERLWKNTGTETIS